MLKSYRSRAHGVLLLLGFASGIPFLLILSTLSLWLSETPGVSKTQIGLLMFASLPYGFKFLWSPLLDCYPIPYLSQRLGHRRAWALLAQSGTLLSLLGLSRCDPAHQLSWMAFWASLVAFCSATFDSIIDAYRIERLSRQHLGSAAAIESVGFRLGTISSGALALYLAHYFGWQNAYTAMAFACLLGIVAILLSQEPPHIPKPGGTVSFSLKSCLPSFSFKTCLLLLFFIVCFKWVDTVLNAMMAPFLHDLGFNKLDFAKFSKVYGTILSIIGGLLSGHFIHRLGLSFVVKMALGLQCLSAMIFITQAQLGHDFHCLILSLRIESLSTGVSATAFIAFLSQFCVGSRSAHDFTLLYSFGSLARVFISSLAGWLADSLSWEALFLSSASLGCMGLFLLEPCFSEQILTDKWSKSRLV